MRIGSVSALVLTAFALAACTGTPSDGTTTDATTLDMCGLSCPDGTPADGITDANGDGVDDNADGNDSSTDGGNTANLPASTSDVTIALETSVYTPPTSGTSLSVLAFNPLTAPGSQKITIDTNTDSNGNWPTPVTMTEYLPGTNQPDPYNAGVDVNGGTACVGCVGYHEYRAISNTPGKVRDEELQVWGWTNSYATQYRNATSSDAPQQAWSFGGTKTALTDMPTSGSASYNGRFVGTAKTSNWIKPAGSDVDPNALWRIQGASTLTANFGAGGTVAGKLTPDTWESDQSGIGGTYTWFVGSAGTVAEPDYEFYHTTVDLNGAITGNTYAGAATIAGDGVFDPGFVSGDNPMYGGFFGPGGAETTGIFTVYGVDPSPIGGSAGINDDRRGYLTMSGAFNGTCTSGVGACP